MKKLCFFLVGIISMVACSSPQKADELSDDEVKPQLRYLPVKYEDSYIFLDVKTGKRVEGTPKYELAGYFFENRAWVGQDGSFFIIDESFKPISNDRYVAGTVFHDGRAYVVRKNGKIEAIDKAGNVVFVLEDAEYAYGFRDGVSVFYTADDEVGLVDVDGQIRIQPGLFYAIDNTQCVGGYAVVRKGDDWGVRTYDGEPVIPFEYEAVRINAALIRNNRVLVLGKEGWGVVDLENNEIIPCEYRALVAEPDGSFRFADKNWKYGWLDAKGNELIEPEFSGSSLFGKEGLAPVEKKDKYGFIDKKGDWVVEPTFRDAEPFQDGRAIVMDSDRDCGLIGPDGEFVVEPKYRDLYYLGENLYYAANRDAEQGVINGKGETVIKMSGRYQYLNPNVADEDWVVFSRYIDVDAIVDQMVSQVNQVKMRELSTAAAERQFETTLNSSGWMTLKAMNGSNYSCHIRGYIERKVTPDFYQDKVSYELVTLAVRFDLRSDKAKRNEMEIFNKLAERLGAEIRKTESGYCEGSGQLGVTLIPDVTAKLTDKEGDFSVVLGAEYPLYYSSSWYNSYEQVAADYYDYDYDYDYDI